MNRFFVLLFMLFCHIVDDYYLQGILASMKQKDWWVKNSPDKKYEHDYIVALIMHSFSWAFMIMLPIAVYQKFEVSFLYSIGVIINASIHFSVDNKKANKKTINLIEDQMCHIAQILVTYLFYMVPVGFFVI